MSSPVVRPHTSWSRALTIGVAGALAVGVVVIAFLWPVKTSSAHDLPVGIAGTETSVRPVQTAIETASPGTITFTPAEDRRTAVEQIERRETMGAIVLGAPGTAPEVLTAPAANAAATQILTGLAAQLEQQLQQRARAQAPAAGADPTALTVTVTPVVPLAATDPNGAGLTAASFPLTLGGMLGGVLVALLVVGPVRRLAALLGFGVVVGTVLAFVLQTWFGFLQGEFWLNAVAVSLAVVATSAFIVGCASLLGRAGLAVGAVVTLFVANPLAAATVPWQFLPEPWGQVGQFLVPGAAVSLLRSLSYFPDAGTAQQWWTLAGWAALGTVLALAGLGRARRTDSRAGRAVGPGDRVDDRGGRAASREHAATT